MDYARAIQLSKLAEILGMPPSHEVTSHFPIGNHQQLWKYKHKDGVLALKNGETIYSFSFPNELYPAQEDEHTSFHIERLNDNNTHYSNIDSPERTAQVHRSHPGQLYVTLHEGKRNPTYTFKHEKENSWKAVLKKKINRQITDLVNTQAGAQVQKQANLYNAGVQAFNAFTNLPPYVPAAAALGGSYLWNRMRKEPDPYDRQHPIISKLMDYGIPLATIMGLYYGGKGMFLPGSATKFNPGAMSNPGFTLRGPGADAVLGNSPPLTPAGS